jgi:hypothetical protein
LVGKYAGKFKIGVAKVALDTVKVNVAVPVPLELVARSPIVKVPAPLTVPDMTPETGFTDNPLGNPEAAKLVGLFVAVI